jgi:membrane protein
VKRVNRAVSALDRWQQRHRIVAIAYAVIRKFDDDNANLWVVALGWYGFTAIYPLLLVVVTIFGFIGVASLGHGIVTTLHQFPVIGSEFNPANGGSNLHGSVFALVVGIVGLLYGAQGVTQSAEQAMARVWNTPPLELPGFFPRLLRSLSGLAIIATAFISNAFVDTLITAHGRSPLLRVPLLIGMFLANVGLYFSAFWALTARFERRRDLLPGAILAGIAFTVLTTVGTGLIQNQLRHTTNTYGAFASVIGVMTYLLLLAKLTLYAAELNPVLARRLWPRALPTTPPTDADNDVLRAVTHEERRRADQGIGVGPNASQ